MTETRHPRWRGPLLWTACLAVPLALALLWGPELAGDAYLPLSHARSLLAARPLGYNLPPGVAFPRAPLFVAGLALLGAVGLPLPQAAALLSAAGWGAAAVVALRAVRRPWAGGGLAALLACSPLVVATLGAPLS